MPHIRRSVASTRHAQAGVSYVADRANINARDQLTDRN
jgi:hypothetical protein